MQTSTMNSNRLSQSLDCIKGANSPDIYKKNPLKPSSLLSSKLMPISQRPSSVRNCSQMGSKSPKPSQKGGYLHLETEGQPGRSVTGGTRSTRTSQNPGMQSQDAVRGSELPQIREVSSAQQLKETLRHRLNQKSMSRAGHSNSTDSIGLPNRVTRQLHANSQIAGFEGAQRNLVQVVGPQSSYQDNSSLISVETANGGHQLGGMRYLKANEQEEGSRQEGREISISGTNYFQKREVAEVPDRECKGQGALFAGWSGSVEERGMDGGGDKCEGRMEKSPEKRSVGGGWTGKGEKGGSQSQSVRREGWKGAGSQGRGHPLRTSNTPGRTGEGRSNQSREERTSGTGHERSLAKSDKSSRVSSCSREGTLVEYQSVWSSSQKAGPEMNRVSRELAESKERAAVEEIFRKLDSDGDGVITSHQVCLEGLAVRQLKILSPLLFELEDLGQSLDSREFHDAVQLLFKSISIGEKRDLLFAPPRHFIDHNLTFQVGGGVIQPAINPSSRGLAAHRRPAGVAAGNLYDLYKTEREQFRAAMELERRAKQESALESCTFRPDTSLSRGWLKREGIHKLPGLQGNMLAPAMGNRNRI